MRATTLLACFALTVAAAGCFDFDRLRRPRDLGTHGGDDLARRDDMTVIGDMAPPDMATADMTSLPDLVAQDMVIVTPLVVTPSDITIIPNAARNLSANLPVYWSIDNGGGTIDGNGHYVAPAATGAHTITAITKSPPIQTVMVSVNVVAQGIAIVAGAPGGSGVNVGPLAEARFAFPVGVGRDGSGNLYAGDWNNHAIYQITTAGTVVEYFSGGSAPQAPTGFALDGKGNLCFADSSTYAVYCTPVGSAPNNFSVRAGSEGVQGNVEGTGSGARFMSPYGLTSDGNGTLYVTDRAANTVRAIDSGGTTTTVVSTGLSIPYGIAFRAPSTLYVADHGNNRVVSIDTGTKMVTQVAPLPFVQGVAWDASTGALYAVDSSNVYVVTTGVVTLIAGGGTGGVDANGTSARFSGLQSLISDGAGNLWAADVGNYTVRKIGVAAPTPVSTVGPPLWQPGSASGAGATARFYQPQQMALVGGNVYIADENNNQIRRWDGTTLTTFSGSLAAGTSDSPPRYTAPFGLASDGSSTLFVADNGSCLVRKLVIATGAVTTLAGVANTCGSGTGQLDSPSGLAYQAASDKVFVADTSNNAIRGVVVSTKIMNNVATGLNVPRGLYYDASSKLLWFTDLSGLGKIDVANGNALTRVVSTPTFLQTQIASDGAGDLYFGDNASRIYKFVISAGTFSVVAGTSGVRSIVEGNLPGVVNTPNGFVFDAAGNLLVSDGAENVLLRLRVP